jgi:hypothetical protein
MPDTAANPGLRPPALEPLPLGAIHPTGWLLGQLRIQADGLSGYLDEFWPDVARSGWIGGEAEGWERGPYWLDGIVPLAFLLDDATLKVKAARWIEAILSHQRADGWLGPVQSKGYEAYDPWPTAIVLKAFTQYYEATGDRRIIDAMTAAFRRLCGVLGERALWEWGKFRWADLVLSLHWLYDRRPQAWLLDLAGVVHAQGYDWQKHFADFRWTDRVGPEELGLPTHVVNNAMAIKAPAVWYRQSGEEADLGGARAFIDVLDRYHGQATGVFTGDEHYAGRNPSQGTELCAVVEYMFSLEVAAGILGDPQLGDRLERIAFNALPATFTPDMWAHQYDQQANQVVCRMAEERVYTNNGPEANIFGLEPNYGCCTANMHQGWPKLASHLWMRSRDGGLAAICYAPCTVRTACQGVVVEVEVVTAYPFDEHIRIGVRASAPVRLPVYLRIPEWSEGAEVAAGGATSVSAAPGAFHRLDLDLDGPVIIQARFPMRPRVTRRYNNSVSLSRGPLVYVLRIGEEWRQIRGKAPRADWEVHPTTPWNYALALDAERPERDVSFESRSLGERPFSPNGAPIMARARGRLLPGGRIQRNAAAPPPESPVSSTEPLTDLVLIPYGCSNLRVTEFPVLDRP